ncbi:hypothetical protein [Polymorphospora sp. NPDC050346]|uniref:hypothetical protein n=1 Tax=Polymorphospora sp. NPDC050346 TaxID=3155780 RepID=UPI0033D31BCD
MTNSSTLPRRLAPTPPAQVVLPRPGDKLSIAACDYLGGTGPIVGTVVDIDATISPLQVEGLEWIHLVVADADRPGAEPRTLIVRVAALRPATPGAEFTAATSTYTGDYSRQPIDRARSLADLATSSLPV